MMVVGNSPNTLTRTIEKEIKIAPSYQEILRARVIYFIPIKLPTNIATVVDTPKAMKKNRLDTML